MTNDTAITEQARAVFLAALMVLSVMVGTVALSGGAAAAVDNSSVSEDFAAPGGTITVSTNLTETTDGTGNASFVINGSEGNTSDVVTVEDNSNADSDDANGSITATLNVPSNLSDGTATVTVAEGDSVTAGSGDDSATFDVDGTPPTYDGASPTGTVTDNSTSFTVNISDDTASGVDANSISVTVTDSESTLLDGVNTSSDNVSFDGTELTVNGLTYADGQVNVEVTAADNVSNSNTSSFDFSVDAVTSVENVEVDETPINVSNNNNQVRNITITFSEDVENVSVNITDIPVQDGSTFSKTSIPGTTDGDTWTYSWDSPEVDSNVDTTGSISVTADDNDTDQSVDETYEFIIDTQPPEITANTSDSLSGDPYDVTQEFDLTNTSGDEVTYEYDAGDGDGFQTIEDPVNFNTSNVSDGDIDLRATVVDDAGNSDEDTGTTVVDNEDPSLTTDLDSELVSDTLDLSENFSAENTDGNSVAYFVDENKDGNFTSISASFDTTTVADGDVDLKANVSDDAENEASATANVTVDNTAPQNVSLDAPEEPVFTNTDSLNVSYSYEEVNSDTTEVTFSSDEENVSDVVYTFGDDTANGDGIVDEDRELDLSDADEGSFTNATYDVTVTATDVANQSGSDTVEDHVTVDQLDPGDITVVEPSEQQIVESDDTLDVAYHYDEDNTESVKITLEGDGDTYTYEIDDSQYQDNGIRKSLTLDLSDNDKDASTLTDGSYNVTIEVTDAAGNTNSTTTDEYVVVNDDAPSVTVKSVDPSGDISPDATVDVTYEVTDVVNTSQVEIRVVDALDNNGDVTDDSVTVVSETFDVDEAPNTEYTKSIDLGGVADNEDYNVSVVVTDESEEAKNNDFDLADNEAPTAGQSANIDVNAEAPTIDSVEANDGSNSVEVTFSEDVVGADASIDETDFAYQDTNGSGPVEVLEAVQTAGNTVELTLDADVTVDNLGEDAISVREGVIQDTHPTDARDVSSGDAFTLEDTTAPTGVSVLVENDGDVNADNIESYDVTVDWNGAESAEANLIIEENGTELVNTTASGAGTASFSANLSDAEHGDSLDVSVTVTDTAGNSQDAPDTTLDVDTEAPTLESAEADAGTDEVKLEFSESVSLDTVTVEVGDEVLTAETDSQFATTGSVKFNGQLPADAVESDVTVNVTATDSAGNSADTSSTIDDAGTPAIDAAHATLDSENVTIDFSESVYGENGSAITAENLTYEGDKEIVAVEHDAGDKKATVTLSSSVSGDAINSDSIAADDDTPFVDSVGNADGSTFAVLQTHHVIENLEVTAEDGELTVTVESNEELDSLEIDVFHENALFDLDTDDVTSTHVGTFTLDDFEEENGTYTATKEAPRDGQYNAHLSEASSVSGSETMVKDSWDTADVDTRDPEPTDSDIRNEAGTDGFTVIDVTFNEPIDASSIDGDDVSIDNVDDDTNVTVYNAGEFGLIQVAIESDVQTGDSPDVTIDGDSYTELTNDSSTGVESGSTTVHTDKLHLDEGENFVSVPALSGSLDLADVDTSNVDVIWTYESGEWKSYDPDADENDFDALEGGQGYIVVMDDDDTLDVNVYNVEAGSSADTDGALMNQHELEEGWNLVGHYQAYSQNAGTAFSSIGENVHAVYEQDGSTGLEYTAVTDGDQLQTGQGYWVFVTEDEVYTFSNEDSWNDS